jgi:hypothetical protein
MGTDIEKNTWGLPMKFTTQDHLERNIVHDKITHLMNEHQGPEPLSQK